MNILLVYPYPKIENVGCYPPISLLYLASPLLKANHNVQIIDVDAYRYKEELILKDASEFEPGLIGLPLFSDCLHAAMETLKVIKEHFPSSQVVLGGPHATAMPDKTLQEYHACDFVIRGEAEKALLELVNALEESLPLENILGLSYRLDGRILHNPERLAERNLDKLDFPARKLVQHAYDSGTYYRIGSRGTTDLIISARGCPHQCSFCFKTIKKFRIRSSENVMHEVERILSRGIRSIHFGDDTFTASRKRCEEILKGIRSLKQKGLSIKLRSRASDVDRDLLRLMKEADVKSIVYGFESGSKNA